MRSLYRIVAVTAAGTAVLSAWLLSDAKPILINRTASLPMGVYIRSDEPVTINSIVSLPLPQVMRPYVDSISPAWGKWLATHPLLKQVVAVEGDDICRANDVFTARGAILAQVTPDVPGNPPKPSWGGCRRLAVGEIAVFAGGLPDAIDSRIFGAVPAKTARVYRAVVTW